MVTIRKHLVSENIALRVTSGKGNTRRKVVIHETDNTRATANANAHSRLQANGNSRQASWHYQVDDKEVVQSFDHVYKCWAAGTSKGNNEGIHVEICVNSDGDYKKAVQNTAELVAMILKEEKLTINDVVQHNYYSGKNCPRIMRSGTIIPWSSFIQMVKSNLEPKKETKPLSQQFLNATGRNECKEMISRGVVEKLFHDKHEDVDNYSDVELLSYAMAYQNRKLKQMS